VYPWALTTAAAAVASAEGDCEADPPVCTNAGAVAVRVAPAVCSLALEAPVVVVVDVV
jgi:hypothetical protein